MSLSALAIKNRTVTYFFALLLLIGGIGSFFQLGQLEDPEFTVKTAVIITAYPGASPREVELEVTDRIELAIQEMPQIDYLKSYSRAGVSVIEVNIKSEYWADRLPQVWDELRRKVRDVEHRLPPGVGRPEVSDDFGDVFGFQLAVTGDGFSYAELERYAKDLKKELSLVTGVSRVDLWGVQQKVVYIDVAQQQLTELGMTDESILKTLNQQNMVVDAGSLDLQNNRYRIAPTGDFQSPMEIADVVIRPSLADQVINLMAAAAPDGAGPRASSELIRIGDVASVRRGYLEPPQTLMRYNGEPAIGISITNVSGVNVVHVGQAIDRRLAELLPRAAGGHRGAAGALDVRHRRPIHRRLPDQLRRGGVDRPGGDHPRHGLAHGHHHRHRPDRHHPRLLHPDGHLRHRPAAHVPGRPGHRPRHDGGQRHRGRRRLLGAPAKGHGPHPGRHRGRQPTVLVPAGGDHHRGDGLLSHLRLGRGRRRVLPHALHRGGHLPALQLAGLHDHHPAAVHRHAQDRQGRGGCRSLRYALLSALPRLAEHWPFARAGSPSARWWRCWWSPSWASATSSSCSSRTPP